MIPLVGWHEEKRGVVFLNEEGNVVLGIKTATLRDMGWTGEDADYRFSLPRVDQSPLAAPAPRLTTRH